MAQWELQRRRRDRHIVARAHRLDGPQEELRLRRCMAEISMTCWVRRSKELLLEGSPPGSATESGVQASKG
jgi:hypothetical protein